MTSVVTYGGVFTVAEAMAAGYTRAQIRHRVATGAWQGLRRGVLVEDEVARRARADPRSHHRLLTAAALAAHAGAWASHESAAVSHGLEFLRQPDLDLVRLTRPARGLTQVRREAGSEIHSCGLPPEHRNDAKRATTPARTVVDLARRLPLLDAVVVADSAMRRRGVRNADLARVLESCRGWPGSVQAGAVLGLADPLAESVLESLSRVELVGHGLPPETQCWLVGPDGRALRVDFLWWPERTVGEADGLGKYVKYGPRPTMDPLKVEKIRQEVLEDWGLEVVRWGMREMRRDSAGVADRVRRGFARSLVRQEIRARNGEVEVFHRLPCAPWDIPPEW